MLPIADFWKILLDLITTFAFVLFGLSYFMYKGIIPIPSPDYLERVRFWLSLGALFLQSGTGFLINAIHLGSCYN